MLKQNNLTEMALITTICKKVTEMLNEGVKKKKGAKKVSKPIYKAIVNLVKQSEKCQMIQAKDILTKATTATDLISAEEETKTGPSKSHKEAKDMVINTPQITTPEEPQIPSYEELAIHQHQFLSS